MGITTTTAYFVDFIGAFCSNGSHGDSHVFNYIVQNNVNGINSLLNRRTDLLGFDRGFKFLWGKFPYWMIMPSLNKTKPVPTLYINVSRLLTHVRWMNEVAYGILKGQWGVMDMRVHQKWKAYATSWHKNIAATHNWMRPNGFVKNTTAPCASAKK